MSTVYVANKGVHNYPFDIYPTSLDGKTMETISVLKGADGSAPTVRPNQVMKTITVYGAYHESRGITHLDAQDWELVEKFYGKNHVLLKSGAVKCFKSSDEAEKYLKNTDTQLIDLGNNRLTAKDLEVKKKTDFAYNEDIKNKVVG